MTAHSPQFRTVRTIIADGAVPSQAPNPLGAIAGFLRLGDVGEALRLADDLLTSLAGQEETLRSLGDLFARGDNLDPFIDLLWRRRETLLCRVSAIARFMAMCTKTGRYGIFEPKLRNWISSEVISSVQFSENDYIHRFGTLSRDQALDLFLAKYRLWPQYSAHGLFNTADELADTFEIEQLSPSRIFTARYGREIELSDWLQKVRSAYVLDHMISDAYHLTTFLGRNTVAQHPVLGSFRQSVNVEDHIDVGRTKTFFEELPAQHGLLLSIFHGGFFSVARLLCGKFMRHHYSLQKSRGGANVIDTDSGQQVAAFRAIKALLQKKTVLIAPDGPSYDPSSASEITVLGQSSQIADGAPLIAYESNCNTGWYGIVRENGRFVPVFKLGPRREPGETFERFKQRWLEFYAAQIEDVLAGNPRNIVLRSRWSSLWKD